MTQPRQPKLGDLWVDSSFDPPMPKVWDGQRWLVVASFAVPELIQALETCRAFFREEEAEWRARHFIIRASKHAEMAEMVERVLARARKAQGQ